MEDTNEHNLKRLTLKCCPINDTRCIVCTVHGLGVKTHLDYTCVIKSKFNEKVKNTE